MQNYDQPFTIWSYPKGAGDGQAQISAVNLQSAGCRPRGENETIAAMVDRGETFFGRISRLQEGKNPWKRLEFKVWLAT